MSEKIFDRAQSFSHREKFDFKTFEKTIKTIVEQKIDNQDASLKNFVDCKREHCLDKLAKRLINIDE